MAMYKVSYVECDNLKNVEFISTQRNEANNTYREKKHDAWVTEVVALTMTVTVVFNKNDIERCKKNPDIGYVYTCEDQLDPKVHKHVIVPDAKDENDIKLAYPVFSGYKNQYEMAEIKKKGHFEKFKSILEALLY